MNDRNHLSRSVSPQPVIPALQAAENEALRLLRGHARDPLTRIAIIFDLKVRRAAYLLAGVVKRIGSGLRSWQGPA